MAESCCFGNWKMNLDVPQSVALARALATGPRTAGLTGGVAPSPLALAAVAEALVGSGIEVVGQACHWAAQGAYTGAISAEQLRAAGATRVLVGHSERRTQGQETLADTERIVAAARRASLGAIVCVGESLAERDAQQTLDVVVAQLMAACAQLSSPAGLVVAYEPVWAIGTGRAAQPKEAQTVHRWLREALLGRFGAEGERVPLLYGGSVTDAAATALASEPDIDGFLVGGASLDAAHFARIGAVLSASSVDRPSPCSQPASSP